MAFAITPTLLISSFQAAYRFARAADEAGAQYVRDAPMVIPGAIFTVDPGPGANPAVFRQSKTSDPDYRRYIESDEALLTAFEVMDDNPLALRLVDEETKIYQEIQVAQILESALADRGNGGLPGVLTRARTQQIAQWSQDDRPVSPWLRLAISFADIAADFVTANPRLVIEDENTSILVGAFAGRLSALIPNDGDAFGLQQEVGMRLLGIAFRAGLEALSENSELVFEREAVNELVDAVIEPVLNGLPSDVAEAFEWKKVREAVMGPAVAAAIRTVAAEPDALLGTRFKTDKIVGAMTKALLGHLDENGLDGTLTREGLLGLFRTALKVVAERPELVLDDDAVRDDFFRDLLAGAADTLADPDLVLDRQLATRLAEITLAAVGEHAPDLLKLQDDKPWEKVAIDALDQVLTGLRTGLADGGGEAALRRVLSTAQIIELGRIVATQAALTPRMILPHGAKPELETIVAALAGAMSHDEGLLLRGRDWLELLAITLDEASRNPERLFGIDDAAPAGALGTTVIMLLLDKAAEGARNAGAGETILFGETLKTALIAALRQAASNPAAMALVVDHLGDPANSPVAKLIEDLLAAVALQDANGRYSMGSKEWLRLFRSLLSDLVAGAIVPRLVDAAGALTEEGRRRIDFILTHRTSLAGA